MTGVRETLGADRGAFPSAIALLALAIGGVAHAQHGARDLPRRLPLLARPDRPPAPEGALETVVELDRTPGNLAIGPTGRMFVSMHPFGAPTARVIEIIPEGGTRPYPSPTWASDVGASGLGIASIIGIRCDSDGVLWMLDAGPLGTARDGSGGRTPSVPKLIGWDTRRDRLHRVIHLPPPIVNESSFLQDFAIDERRGCIYIADSGISAGPGAARPALIVVYLATGVSKRVLENAPCVRAEPEAAMVIDGRDVRTADANGTPVVPAVGVNPIAIDADGEWVYFGAMHGTSLYRIKAAHLSSPGQSDEGLQASVERWASKPVSDGIAIDAGGAVYITDVTNNAIGVIEPGKEYRVLVSDPMLSWPDSITIGPDGHLWVVANQLHRHPALNWTDAGPKDDTVPPFRIVRHRGVSPAGPSSTVSPTGR